MMEENENSKNDFQMQYLKNMDIKKLYNLNSVHLSFLIEKTFNNFESYLEDYLKNQKFTKRQIYILYVLDNYSNIPQEKIASILDFKEVTITREINILEKNNLISRKIDQNDKRKKLVNITSRGKEALDKINLNKLDDNLEEYMTKEELYILKMLLNKIILSLKQDN